MTTSDACVCGKVAGAVTCQSHVHLGGLVVQQQVVQSGDGIEQDGVNLRRQQAHQIRNAPTVVDHEQSLPAEQWHTALLIAQQIVTQW